MFPRVETAPPVFFFRLIFCWGSCCPIPENLQGKPLGLKIIRLTRYKCLGVVLVVTTVQKKGGGVEKDKKEGFLVYCEDTLSVVVFTCDENVLFVFVFFLVFFCKSFCFFTCER